MRLARCKVPTNRFSHTREATATGPLVSGGKAIHPPRKRRGAFWPISVKYRTSRTWPEHHVGGGADARRPARALDDRGGDGYGDLRVVHRGGAGADAPAGAGGRGHAPMFAAQHPFARWFLLLGMVHSARHISTLFESKASHDTGQQE